VEGLFTNAAVFRSSFGDDWIMRVLTSSTDLFIDGFITMSYWEVVEI
jgi:hypothetical protein